MTSMARMDAMRRMIGAFLLLGIGAPAVTHAHDWTGFQGPRVLTDPTKPIPWEWTPTNQIAWTVECVGYGQSSPVTWQQQVYVTSVSGSNKDRCHVVAYELRTGEKRWQVDLTAASGAENNNYVSRAAPTPVVDAAGLVCFFEGGNLLALTHDGKIRWQRDLVQEFGPIESRHGLAASLEQDQDRVYVWVERANEPYLLAVQKASGQDVWKVPGIGTTSWASPRLVPVPGGQHLVLSGMGLLVGLDPTTGVERWRFTDIRGNSTPTPVPVAEGRFLIAATTGRGEADTVRAAESNGLITIRQTDPTEADSAWQAEFVWRAKRATSSFGSPLAYQGHAYFVNSAGVLYCLDLATGEERYAERLADSMWATPLPIQGRLYFFGKGGQVSIVEPGQTFRKLAENTTWETAGGTQAGGRTFGGPVLYAAALTESQLLLRRGDKLFCIAAPSE